MPTNKQRLFTIIKLLGAIIIIYAGITLNVKQVGEDETQVLFQDYLEQSETTNTGDIGHFSAPEDDFQKICNNFPICNKIIFGGEFQGQEKIEYTKKTDKVSSFINDNNLLNSGFTKKITSITINNSEDNRRGYATRDSVVFNLGSINNLYEYQELVAHELGHIFDLGFIQGKNLQKHPQFTEFKKQVFSLDDPSLRYYKLSRKSETTRKETTKKKDFCSGYGMTDPFEDFAECFNLYIHHNSMFKYIAKGNDTLTKKHNFIASLLKGKYIKSNNENLLLVKENNTRRPRDTTKID